MALKYHSCYWLPGIMGMLLLLGLAMTYGIAVALGHVSPIFPFISDTGGLFPESCVFAQVLNVVSVIGLTTLCLRYKLHRALYPSGAQNSESITDSDTATILSQNEAPRCYTYLVKINGVVGSISCLAFSIVGNFQNSYDVVWHIHTIGAVVAFSSGTFYIIIDAIISWKLCPKLCDKLICGVRIFLAALSFVFFWLLMLCIGLVKLWWPDIDKHKLIWAPSDPGYGWNLTAASAEWLMSLAFILYFFTFFQEFPFISAGVDVKVDVKALFDSLNPQNSHQQYQASETTLDTVASGNEGMTTPITT